MLMGALRKKLFFYFYFIIWLSALPLFPRFSKGGPMKTAGVHFFGQNATISDVQPSVKAQWEYVH